MQMTFRVEDLASNIRPGLVIRTLFADESVDSKIIARLLATGNEAAIPELILAIDSRSADWDVTRKINSWLTKAKPLIRKPNLAASAREPGKAFTLSVEVDSFDGDDVCVALLEVASGRELCQQLVYELIKYLNAEQLNELRRKFRAMLEKERGEIQSA
ncbi:hypothetical protein [Streptomyces sp. CBMA156]|uniref:hypothetical protein n=1 Tax=Streptomyces sp. CBMA156 TaxID=1930280 RepID=UPI001661A8F1|nr:hypothetical protein [Streptomyces sp. CBMA156]MBD0673957.1 hypothetical protein [Streptomyces sp. CBMA156]